MDLPTKFQDYLKNKRVSARTLRNYRSDLNHFFAWAKFHLNTDNILPHFSGHLLANYKGYHLENKIPTATANRRLSTLRSFSKFLHASGLIEKNSADLVSNVQEEEDLIKEYAQHLKKDGVSPVTLKNYISDIRQFLAWIPGQEV